MQDTRYKVVARAATPAELSTFCCPKGQPTLAIIGIDLQNANLDQVAAGVRLVRSVMPNAKVMLVAEAAKPIDLQRVPGLSVDACIFSLCSRDTLIKVLELTFMDQHVFVLAKSVAAASKEDVDFDGTARGSPPTGSDDFGNGQNLSARESQVLACLAEGKSNKLIARACHISEATVKVHLKAILRKTKAHNRTGSDLGDPAWLLRFSKKRPCRRKQRGWPSGFFRQLPCCRKPCSHRQRSTQAGAVRQTVKFTGAASPIPPSPLRDRFRTLRRHRSGGA